MFFRRISEAAVTKVLKRFRQAPHLLQTVRHLVALIAMLAVVTSASPRAMAEECQGIRVGGDAIWADALLDHLRDAGAPIALESRCPAVDVRCEAAGGAGMKLMLRDSQGRTAQRVIRDVATAAVWVETWLATTDLEPEPPPEPAAPEPARPGPPASPGPKTSAPKPPAPAPEPAAPVKSTESVVARAAAPIFGEPAEPRYSLGVATEFLLDGKSDVLGGGLRLAGCGRVGPVCLGGSLRVGLSDEVGHPKRHDRDERDDRDDTEEGGWSGALALTVEKGWAVGGVQLIPGLALGVRVDQRHLEEDPEVVYRRPPPKHKAVWNFEVAASFRVLVPIEEAWAVDIGAHFGIAPLDAIDHDFRYGEPPAWTFALGAGFRFGGQ